MSTAHKKAALAVLYVILVSATSLGADSLTGRVMDPQGQVVSSARLRLFARSNGELRTTLSSAEGAYAFPGIPPGNYVLEADASSSALIASQPISVSGDQQLDIGLAVSSMNVEVLVTASGTPLSFQEVAKAVNVVDSKQIAQHAELSISEAIRNLPGIRVQTLEGPGSLTTINVRGLRGQDTAVLIDGMRFRDAASPQGDATAFLGDMTVVDTERIEFLRGSGSSLYGSSALAGVINITSRPGGGAKHGEFRIEGGGLGLIRSVAGIGGSLFSERLGYSGGIAHVNVTRGARDGNPYRNTAPQAIVRYAITPAVSVTGRVWGSRNYLASTESPTYTGAMAAGLGSGLIRATALPLEELRKFENREPFDAGNSTFIPNQIDPDERRIGSFFNGSLAVQHQLSPGTSYRVAYQRVNTERVYIDGPAGPGSFDPGPAGSRRNNEGDTNTLQARADVQAGAWNLITAGYEFEAERYYSFVGLVASSNSVDLRQHSHAVYVQDQVRLMDGQLQLTAAGRAQSFKLRAPAFAGFDNPYADVSAVEPPTSYTGDGAAAYFVRSTNTKLRAHVGNSFRAPSGYERFGGEGGFYYGDPRLASERSIAVDGGIDQWLFSSQLQMSGTIYYTKLQETIRFADSFAPGADPFGRLFGGYANGGGGIARGFELSGRFTPTLRTSIDMSYTFVNSDSRTPTAGTDYYKSLGISTHTFTLTAAQWIGTRVNVAFDISALSEYTMTLFGLDFSARPFVFSGPKKADAVVHYSHPLSSDRTLEFYGKVENIFNRQAYEDGFIGPKAWAVAGLRYSF
jgi:iron complex outermembrane receptor protein